MWKINLNLKEFNDICRSMGYNSIINELLYFSRTLAWIEGKSGSLFAIAKYVLYSCRKVTFM